MMKKNIKFIMVAAIALISWHACASEFIKKKEKKEIAVRVKEDIAELLESSLRQLGKNIQLSVAVENHIFDKIKEICGDSSLSTAQLKELREKLEKYLKIFEDQQADLNSFLLQCK